jgi:uncharacterized membrane protein
MRHGGADADGSVFMNGYVLIGLAILCAAISQLLFKSGVEAVGGIDLSSRLVGQGVRMLSNWRIITGLVIYVIGWLMWMAALSRFDLSFAYPFTSVNYILVTILSVAILGETLSPVRVIGIAVICIGLVVLSRG